MRIPESDVIIVAEKLYRIKCEQVKKRKEEILLDPRIDELIARTLEFQKNIPDDISCMLGRYLEKVYLKMDTARQKAAYILGINIPDVFSIHKGDIEREVRFFSIMAKNEEHFQDLIEQLTEKIKNEI